MSKLVYLIDKEGRSTGYDDDLIMNEAVKFELKQGNYFTVSMEECKMKHPISVKNDAGEE